MYVCTVQTYVYNISKICKEKKKKDTYLNGGCIDFKLLVNGKCFLVEFTIDGNVCNVRCIVVVQPGDVLHHSSGVGPNGREDQQVLQVPKEEASPFLQHRGTVEIEELH